MSHIETNVLKNSTIMFMFSEREEIDLSPDYQRAGGVWNLEKKQLLIDSILNNYDIPKIYFHDLSDSQSKSEKYSYSVIDGRQRLESIWQFMNGEFPLADDFVYQKYDDVSLDGLYYGDIATQHPKVRIRFDSFILPVVLVRTSDGDIDLIEDMFSRLNEAVPLNTPEKRNAIGGHFVKAIRRVSENEFFLERVKFSNSRYQHREVAARMLLIEHCYDRKIRLFDTKKVYLDALAKHYKSRDLNYVKYLEKNTNSVLFNMASVFSKGDALLTSHGNMAVYYLAFKDLIVFGSNAKYPEKKF